MGTKMPNVKKNLGGRPKTTTADLPKNWKDIVINLSARGYSEVGIRSKLCMPTGKPFCYQTWYTLKSRDVEFYETLQIGKVLCQAWWEEKSMKNLLHSKAKVFETGSWYANMKNRFGWRDIQEVEHKGSVYLLEKFKDTPVGELKNRLDEIIRGSKN